MNALQAPQLAALLDQARDEITTAWAESTRSIPGSRYAQHSVDEIRPWLAHETEATVRTLSTGSFEPTEKDLRDVAQGCLEAGFGISEVIEGMMLFREAALPVLFRAYPGGGHHFSETISALDNYLRYKIGRFGHLYSEAVDAELRRSEQRFRTVADFAYDWETWIDAEGEFVYVSPSCERITGYRAEQFHTEPGLLERIIHAEDRDQAVDHLRQESVEGSTLQPIEFRIITAAGEERWLEHVCQPVYDANGEYMGRRGSNRDSTERKRVEGELEQHVRDKAAAAERSRLGRELHDSVTQALYSVNLHAKAASLALDAGDSETVATGLQNLQTMTAEAMKDLRMLIFELHPPILKKEGLTAALRTRLATVETRAGMQTELIVEGDEQLPLPVAEELFWIGVETFNNVLKHANARKVAVTLTFEENRVELVISDDGLGFDPQGARAQSGLGLRTIAERVERVDGELHLSTTPGQGTTLRIEAPL